MKRNYFVKSIIVVLILIASSTFIATNTMQLNPLIQLNGQKVNGEISSNFNLYATSPPVETYGYTTYLSNLTLSGSMIVDGDSDVFGENIELSSTSYYGDWYLVARNNSHVELNNLTYDHSVNGRLFIYASDNSWIVIRDSILPSFIINLIGNARVDIYNTIIETSFTVYMENKSTLYMFDSKINVANPYDEIYISQSDMSYLYMVYVDFGPQINRFSHYIYDNSIAIYTYTNLNASGNIDLWDRAYLYLWGFRNMGAPGYFAIRMADYSFANIVNSYIVMDSYGMVVNDYSSLYIDHSTLKSSGYPFSELYFGSVGYLWSFNSHIDNMTTFIPRTVIEEGYNLSPDPRVIFENTTIYGINLFGPQRALLNNSQVLNLTTFLWFYGDVNVTNGKFSLEPGTIGPYPFISQNSTITFLYNKTTIYASGALRGYDAYFINSNFYFKNTTLGFTSFINSLGSFSSSAVYMISSYYSIIEIYDSTMPKNNAWYGKLFVSDLTLVNDPNLFVYIQTNQRSNLNVIDSRIDHLEVSSLWLDRGSSVNLYNNYINDLGEIFIYMDQASVNLFNISGFSSNMTTLGVTLQDSDFSATNVIIGQIDLGGYNSSYTFVNSILALHSGQVGDAYNNTFMFHSTSLNTSLYLAESSTAYLYSGSWVRELAYDIWVSGSVEILNGLIVNGVNYISNLYIDTTSSIGLAIPGIYASSYVKVNDSIIKGLTYGDGTYFVLDNVTIYGQDGGILSSYNVTTDDPRDYTVNGYILNSNLSASVAILIGYGNVLIDRTSIGFVMSILTNTTITNGSINYLIDVLYDSNGATLINNVPINFDGSYINLQNTLVFNYYYGVVAQGTADVSLENSNVALLASIDSSKITAFNITPIDTVDFGYLQLYVGDFGNITLIAFNSSKSIYREDSIIVKQNGFLLVKNSYLKTKIRAYDSSLVYIIDSEIGYTSGFWWTTYKGGISAYNFTSIEAHNSVIHNLYILGEYVNFYGWNLTTKKTVLMTSDPSSIISLTVVMGEIGNILAISNALGGIRLIFIDSVIRPTSFFSSSIFAINSTIEVYGNSTWSEIRGSSSIYQSSIYLQKTIVYMMSIHSSYIDTTYSNITYLHAYTSNIRTYNSNTSKLLLYDTTLTVNMSFIDQMTVAERIFYGRYVKSVFSPRPLPTIKTTDFKELSDELTVIGIGYFGFDRGTYSSFLYTTVNNATTTYTGVNVLDKTYEIVSFYVDTNTRARITNFERTDNNLVDVIKISYWMPSIPSVAMLYGSAQVFPNDTIFTEVGNPFETLIYQTFGSAILENFMFYVNGSLTDSGFIYDKSFNYLVDPNNYITAIGYYNFTFIINDVDGRTIEVTLFFYLAPSEPPSISRQPNTDLEFEIGMSANVKWTITDYTPTIYMILINGVEAFNGTYTSGETINFDASGNLTSPGTYNVTLVAYDSSNNKAKNSLIVTVYSSEPPTITLSPDDATINVNEIIKLEWSATDRFPSTYSIYVNGSIVVSNKPWNSGDKIQYNFTNDKLGKYNITIVFTDEAGNSVSDTVMITVKQVSGGFGITQILMVIGVILIVLIGIIVILRFRSR